MNHQPFEDWLLNDEHLTAGEEWELKLHLSSCAHCAKLAHANRILRAAPMSTPPNGFMLHFQQKLAAERRAKLIRNIIGLTLILVVGTGVIFLLAPAYLSDTSLSSTQLAVTWSTRLIYLGVALRALSQNGNVFTVAATYVPSYIWVLTLLALVGSVFFWFSSSQRFTGFIETRQRKRSAAGNRR